VARILILGASGEMASAAIRELLRNSDHELLLADRYAPSLAELDRQRKRARTVLCDLFDGKQLAQLLSKCDLVLNALYMRYVLPVTRAAIEAGAHLVDLGAYATDTAQQLSLHPKARKAGSRIVMGCGVAPGLTNILARHAIDQLEHVERIGIYSYITHPLTTSPGIVYTRFDASMGLCPVCIEGKLVRRPAFADSEVIEFPPPYGRQEVHLVPHPEPLTLWRSFRVPNVVFKVGYPADETQRLRALIELGLASAEPFSLGGKAVVPREFIAEYIPTTHRPGRARTANVKRVVVTGVCHGQRRSLTYDFAVESGRRSASAKITGTFAALAACQVLDVGRPGVYAPETGLNAGALLGELERRGFEIRESLGDTG